MPLFISIFNMIIQLNVACSSMDSVLISLLRLNHLKKQYICDSAYTLHFVLVLMRNWDH